MLKRDPLKAKLVDENGSEIDIYSEEGLELMAELWTKVSVQHKIMYEPTWLGIPVIQYPGDMVMMQELIWKVRPEVIVETGFDCARFLGALIRSEGAAGLGRAAPGP